MSERGQELTRVIALLPAVIALGLASLYGIGAMLETAQIQDAGLTVRDTLPLFPLEQLLGRGIGTVTLAAGSAVLAVLVLIGMTAADATLDADLERVRADAVRIREAAEREVAAGRPERAREIVNEAQTRLRRKIEVGKLVLRMLVGGLVVLLLTLPPVAAVGLGVVFGGAFALLRRGVLPHQVAFMLVTYAGVVVVMLVQAFVDPEPMARAELTLARGQEVRGELVVSTADQWVLATAERQLRIIPADQVIDARVVQREETRESVLKLITGWDF